MKPYKNLRVKLIKEDKSIKDLEPILNRSNYYINNRINAHNDYSFNELEIYKIMKFINEPVEQIGFYFNENQRKGVK